MNRSGVNLGRAFVADYQAAEVLQPGIRALGNPAAAVTAQPPPILVCRLTVSGLRRDNWFNPTCSQSSPHRVKSERSTQAINQYHRLRSLAALELAEFEPPFFALTKGRRRSAHPSENLLLLLELG